MSNFTLSVIADSVLRNRIGFNKAQSIIEGYGITLRREPMGLTFWSLSTGKRLHGEFNF